MASWSRRIPFRVDIAGIIEIMGSSLYSRADTPVRELIQNAHDAVLRRRKRDLSFQGRIDIVQDAAARTLRFSDDGVGLSPEEAETYLGTLGAGITGLIKRGRPVHSLDEVAAEIAERASGSGDDLIGQFGVGLFSAFMLAERVTVESRKLDCPEAVRWEAGPGTDILLSSSDREAPGTSITLHLKPSHQSLSEQEAPLEAAIKEFADFLPVPIFLNGGAQRVNVINVAWFDPTPDRESVELELEGYFHETPLDVIPLRLEKPVSIAGALYVSPQGTPGFADEATVAVTVRRMVIARKIRDLLPPWASFLRGVLELHDCSPTASREDLVRDDAFLKVKLTLEQKLYEYFESLAESDPTKLDSIIAWHRYTLAGSALHDERLRGLLRRTYRLPTSQGQLAIEQILEKSQADPLFEQEADRVVWYNTDRRQERWVNDLFAGNDVPCVHALRSFEESLLAAWIADEHESGEAGAIDLRTASPSAPGFASTVLGIHDVEEAPDAWRDFLATADARILCASFHSHQPVMAFLNERYELSKTFDDLKKEGTVPAGFQRLIDQHFADAPPQKNEVMLNRNHRLVSRALSQKTSHPLASVLRLLVFNALNAAGAPIPRDAQSQQIDDLDWIAEALWGREKA
ncbi:MAG: ATP-binding protein [Planctomycetes bacterium]|nr:ATP-binding protein [Planctomycetota bacterium]